MASSATTVTAVSVAAAAPHAALPSGASAKAHEAAAAAPYRIPIQLLPPGSTKSVAPDFLVCLLDQLHTPEQRAARQAAHTASAAAAASSSSGAATASVASLSADRPTHDRLPVLLAISSHNVAAAAAAAADEPSVGSSAAVAAAASIGGVCHVTLLQAADEQAWHASRERTEQSVHPNVRNVVRTVAVPLAHASRCPCRAPPPPQIDASPADAAESTSAAATASAAGSVTATATAAAAAAAAAECAAATSSFASAAPAPSQQLRLAVVVVPTLHSLSHCHRCAPHLPTAHPVPRVLVTRRPGSMRAFPGCWVFPGGACDPTDRSLAHTGARELAEETGLRLAASAAHSQSHDDGDEDEDDSELTGMRVVSAWEAVFPVLRPSGLGPGQKFLPKGRYLIVMFAAEVAAQAQAGVEDGAGGGGSGGGGGGAACAAPCVRCEVPLRLCPTEVDAAAWMSGAEFDAVRARAAYFHTDDEAALQKQQQPQLDPSADAASQQQQCPPQRCMAETDECGCAELPAMVTRAYYEQHAAHTTLLDRPCAVVSAPPAPHAAPDASATAADPAATPADPFLPARMRCCALFGLYPNRAGSGMAEGHLVALEEMRALGIF